MNDQIFNQEFYDKLLTMDDNEIVLETRSYLSDLKNDSTEDQSNIIDSLLSMNDKKLFSMIKRSIKSESLKSKADPYKSLLKYRSIPSTLK